MTLHRSLELRNTTPGHNKFYRITIEELTEAEAALRKNHQWRRFILRAHWGPVGKAGVSQEKGAFDSYQMANRAALPLTQSKMSKGYHTVEEFLSASPRPALVVKDKRSVPPSVSAKPEGPDLSRFTNIELL